MGSNPTLSASPPPPAEAWVQVLRPTRKRTLRRGKPAAEIATRLKETRA